MRQRPFKIPKVLATSFLILSSQGEWSLGQWLQVLILCGEDVGSNPAGCNYLASMIHSDIVSSCSMAHFEPQMRLPETVRNAFQHDMSCITGANCSWKASKFIIRYVVSCISTGTWWMNIPSIKHRTSIIDEFVKENADNFLTNSSVLCKIIKCPSSSKYRSNANKRSEMGAVF
jgi:hypothetical protein